MSRYIKIQDTLVVILQPTWFFIRNIVYGKQLTIIH